MDHGLGKVYSKKNPSNHKIVTTFAKIDPNELKQKIALCTKIQHLRLTLMEYSDAFDATIQTDNASSMEEDQPETLQLQQDQFDEEEEETEASNKENRRPQKTSFHIVNPKQTVNVSDSEESEGE